LLAIERLDAEQPQHYNVGIGHGYSVREVIESAERVTGRKITVIYGDRRLGDPPELWANADKIRSKLGWSPQFTVLDDLIGTAWEWMQTHANGYGNTDTAETSAD
jgi:UDP-glucose 4-epimerase